MQYLSGYNIAYDREYSQERFEMAPGAAGDAAARMTKDTSAVKSTESCMFGDKKIVDTLHWGLLYILVGLLHFGLFHESARSGPASFGQGFSKLKVWHRRDIAFNMYSMAVMSCMVIYQRLTHYANESAIEASNHRHDSIFNHGAFAIDHSIAWEELPRQLYMNSNVSCHQYIIILPASLAIVKYSLVLPSYNGRMNRGGPKLSFSTLPECYWWTFHIFHESADKIYTWNGMSTFWNSLGRHIGHAFQSNRICTSCRLVLW